MKKKILIFCDFYLPSYKSGGGMWTIVNLVEHFHEQYDFYIVTRNYDSKGDTTPYTSVATDQWNQTGEARVYYCSKQNLTRKKFAELVREVAPDAFFLNSAFALPVVKFLMTRRQKLLFEKPVILAPCGEFSAGALSVKPAKKKIFLKSAKLLNLYRGIIWKASFPEEKAEIRNLMGQDATVFVAPDLAAREILPDYQPAWKPLKKRGELKLVFLSRLARKKNIHYILERLAEIDRGKIAFDIVGPLEDLKYWEECRAIIQRMPKNVTVRQIGSFPSQTEALKKVSASHFFVLPTLNENFGYVFIEGMAAGCPVLTSDRTVWHDLESKNAGWQISLEKPEEWIARLNQCLAMDQDEYLEKAQAARSYALEWIGEKATIEANRKVLTYALEKQAEESSLIA